MFIGYNSSSLCYLIVMIWSPIDNHML